MRKQELLAVHQLLGAVRGSFEDRGIVEPEAYEEYDEFGVSPTHVHYGKGKHREAIWKLLNAQSDSLVDVEEPEVDPVLAAMRSR